MTATSTLEYLKAMRLSAMAEELKRQTEDSAAFSQLGFEERTALIVDAEWNRRQANKLRRYINTARFAAPGAAIEDIEYYEDRRLDKAQMLRLSTCKYIDDGHHVILRGASGNGKTYIACALGNAACRKFKTVRYIRMPELLDELSVAKACGEFQKAVKKYKQVDLLILDEWLIRCLSPDEACNLLEIIEARSTHGSTIFCTQFETDGWYYEPVLNTEIMSTVQEYSMRGHFIDLKQAAVFGILKALANYDISLGVPFLVYKEYYVKNEIDDYIRTMRTGYTVQSSDEYKLLRKTIALYNKYGKSDDDTMERIAAEIGKKIKDTKEIIAAGLRNMSYAEFYCKYADEDGESSAEDVTRDDTTDPAKMFFDEWRADAVFDRYKKLDIRERSMIADHLGFCRECHGVLEKGTDENGEKVLLFRQKKAYADLALQHTLSSPDTAYRIVHKAYDKILVDLAVDEYIHIVELRRKKKTKAEIVYEYCADHNNDWGEIHYTPGDDDYDVTRYVYADKKGGFFFAAAGDRIIRQAAKEQFPQTVVIPITKI